MEAKVISRENFSKICRICLFPNELLPINSTNINIFVIFKKITNLEVKDDDELPKNICKICVQLLQEIEIFIEESKDNYSVLLLALNQKDDLKVNTAALETNSIFEYASPVKTEESQFENLTDQFLDSETKHSKRNDNFYCAQCDMKFNVKKQLVLHIAQLHGAKADIYELGGDTSKNCNISNREHKIWHYKRKRKKMRNFKYNCTECDRILTSQSALDNHMKTHTGDRPYNCQYCDKNFAFSGSLTIHTRTHTGETPFSCTICNKAYCSSSSLKKHHEKYHFELDEKSDQKYILEDLGKVECKFCKKMLNKHGYGTHLRIHTNERKEFVCSFCPKQFKKMSHLDRHIRIHTGERPFVCAVCKKSFTQEGDLKRHWLTHSGQKEFQCQHCGKLYYTKSALDTHLIIHTNAKKSIEQCNKHVTLPTEQKSFLCTICGKSFTASNSLKIHLRLHSGVCPFVCSYCDKAYTNTSNLKRHVMTNHTFEKPHVCMICQKGFHDSTNLKRHVNRVHSVLEIKDKNEDGGANLIDEKNL